MLKKLIKHFFGRMGLEIKRKSSPFSDLSIYDEIYPAKTIVEKNFFNIGAGDFYHPNWTNIDLRSDWYANAQNAPFINYDLLSLKPLPINDNISPVVYTSHTIEHIPDAAVQYLFNEVYRILEPNGFFRVTTPNIMLLYESLINNERFRFSWIEIYSEPKEMKRLKIKYPMNQVELHQVFLFSFAAQTSVLHEQNQREISKEEFFQTIKEQGIERALNHYSNQCSLEIHQSYPGNHINWFNYGKLEHLLTKAGFTNIYCSGYGQSNCPILRNTLLFDNTRASISLYVEARK